jgi:hypothetical protein
MEPESHTLWVVLFGPSEKSMTDEFRKYTDSPKIYGPFDKKTAGQLCTRLNEVVESQGADHVESWIEPLLLQPLTDTIMDVIERVDLLEKAFSKRQVNKFLKFHPPHEA